MLRRNDFKCFWYKCKSGHAGLKRTMIASITFKYLEQGYWIGIALLYFFNVRVLFMEVQHKRIILFWTCGQKITFKYLEQGHCIGIALIFFQCSCSFHGSVVKKNNSFLDTWPEYFCTYKFLCLHVQPCPLHVQHFPLIMQRDCLACVNIHMWLAYAKGCLHVQASTQEKNHKSHCRLKKFRQECILFWMWLQNKQKWLHFFLKLQSGQSWREAGLLSCFCGLNYL